MGFDPLSPIAPARVRCLLLPCGRIRLDRFSTFIGWIKQLAPVRLSDISPASNAKEGIFSPSAFPSGSILYDFSTADVAQSSRHLVPFELYRQPFLVLGIADGFGIQHLDHGVEQAAESPSQVDDTNARPSEESSLLKLSRKISVLRDQHPTALVHRILIFDFEAVDSLPDSMFGIPPIDATVNLDPVTGVLRQISSQFLDELSSFAKSIQALPNIETPAPRPQPNLNGDSPRTNPSRDHDRSANRSAVVSPSTTPGDAGDRSPYRASLPVQGSSPLAPEFRPGRDRSMSPMGRSRPPITFDEMDSDRPASAPTVDRPHPSNRVSVHGFGSGTTGERARNQARGRLGLVLGSMYLLAGRWTDAIKELVDSATIAKWSSDHPWHAKALDYILVGLLMCGWAGLHFEIPQICYPGERPPWNTIKPLKLGSSGSDAAGDARSERHLASLRSLCQLLPDLVNHILYFYTRATTSSYSDKVPMLSFSESVIRFATLLGIVRVSQCRLDDDCLRNVVDNSKPKKQTQTSPAHSDSFSTGAEIAALAFRATPTFDTEDFIEVMDRLSILSGIASVFDLLDFHRKKAFILRDLIIGLLPALVQSRKDNAAELGFHPAASLSVSDLMAGSIDGLGSSRLSGQTNGGISAFLDILCNVYGVIKTRNGPFTKSIGQESITPETSDVSAQAIQRAFGNPTLKMDVLRWSINTCEALPDLEGMLRFSSYLLATASSGMAPGPESNDAYPTIPTEDQIRLMDTLFRASSTLKQLGATEFQAGYWDEFLIREVEVVTPSASDLPMSRSKRELQLASGSTAERRDGPFIYNPFASKSPAPTKEPILLLYEGATFMVLIQNLFDVNLEIDWLKLDVKEECLEASAKHLIIGPYRTQKVYLSGKAKTTGLIHISACIAKVKGCDPRSFSIFESAWKPLEDSKVKSLGLDALSRGNGRPISTSSDPFQMLSLSALRLPTPSSFTVNVIKNQPVVQVKPLALSQSTVMALLGQRRTIPITLLNTSDGHIDFLTISFVDSTSDVMQAAVDDKNMPPSEVYEIEYSAYHKPAFRLLNEVTEQGLAIPPRERLFLEIEVFGKPGLTRGAMLIDYAHLGTPKTEIGEKFWTRQLAIPLAVTVNASVDLARTEILPLKRGSIPNMPMIQVLNENPATERLSGSMKNNESSSQTLLQGPSALEGKCLLLLDFHNSWPRPLNISLHYNCTDHDTTSTSEAMSSVAEVIQPGRSARLMLSIPQAICENPHAPIPAINPANKRQFVVSTTQTSIEIERIGREMFWYREEILKRLRASWQEAGTERVGEINLRTMRLSPRMVDLLKPEAMHVQISLQPSDSASGDSVKRLGRSRFQAHVDAFAKVVVKLTNRSSHPIHPLLRLQPSLRNLPYNVALDLSRKIAFNGLLQRPLALLKAEQSAETTLGIVFLCAGEYEIGACVEELKPWAADLGLGGNRPRAATGDFAPSDFESRERRVWYASSPCLIDVSSS